ncbi:hypothetical protein Rt10032_c08g3529 [Rhodotorula toruloides]|uniref:Yeast cell wall synthesis Kre9/Knh1-like N-terminal domain-containing protein n=1 Tax=Rhodotorula toruloides TaxID=5286 RepID=A0A511KGP0_RHOTO|nr:hypothetical protein Rt10032_c08g3529 [Rhodotorula toruloides]
MRLSALSSVLFLLPSLASATYFTNPTASTVWANAAGQSITWHYQPGGAPRGDIVLSAVGGSGTNPKNSNSLTIAGNVDLTSGSLTFPSGTALRSNSRHYYLAIVNSANPTDVYTQVGPFEIDGFGAATSPSTPSSSDGAGGAVGNGSGQEATATNPPVSTASPTSSESRTASPSPSSSRSASRAPTSATRPASSTTASSPVPSSSASSAPPPSFSPPPSSSSSSSPPASSTTTTSSSSTTTHDPITATVIETASSGILITSILLPSTSANSNASVVTVTASAASGSVGQASQSARPSSGAGRTGVGAGLAAVAAVAGVWALV